MLNFTAWVQFRNYIKWASKIQASLNCHKTPSSQTYQVHLWKNTPKPKRRGKHSAFQWCSGIQDVLLGWRGTSFPEQEGWRLHLSATNIHKLFTQAIQLSFNKSSYEFTFKKRLFEQTTPHMTQFFHKGPHHAIRRYRQFTLLTSVWKSFTCDNRIGLRPRNTCSQICRSRAGYIGLHVIQSTS